MRYREREFKTRDKRGRDGMLLERFDAKEGKNERERKESTLIAFCFFLVTRRFGIEMKKQ